MLSAAPGMFTFAAALSAVRYCVTAPAASTTEHAAAHVCIHLQGALTPIFFAATGLALFMAFYLEVQKGSPQGAEYSQLIGSERTGTGKTSNQVQGSGGQQNVLFE